MKLEQLKAIGEHFKAGSIIPQRILKGKRSMKHNIVFCSETWAFPTNHGYVLMSDTKIGGSAIKIKGKFQFSTSGYFKKKNKGFRFFGSPYIKNSLTHWACNDTISNDEWAESVCKALGK